MHPCAPTGIYSGGVQVPTINSISYTVSNPTLTSTIPAFTSLYPICSQIFYTLWYNGGAIPSCMTFNPSTLTITTYTTSTVDQGTYLLELRGTISGTSVAFSAFFNFVINLGSCGTLTLTFPSNPLPTQTFLISNAPFNYVIPIASTSNTLCGTLTYSM